MLRKICAAFCTVWTLASLCHGGAIYVAPGGQGDGSSWETPLGCIQVAVNLAIKDTSRPVWIKGGTYVFTLKGIAIPDGVQVYGSFEGHESTPEERKHAFPPGIMMRYQWDFASPTILKWENDYSWPTAVTMLILENGGQVLDGVTIDGFRQGVKTEVYDGVPRGKHAWLRRSKIINGGADDRDGMVTAAVHMTLVAEDCLAFNNSTRYGGGFHQIKCYRCLSANNRSTGGARRSNYGHGGGFRHCITYNCISVNNDAFPYGEQGVQFIHGTAINNTGYTSYQNPRPGYGSVLLPGKYSIEHECYIQPDYCLLQKGSISADGIHVTSADWPQSSHVVHTKRDRDGIGNRVTDKAACLFVRPTVFLGRSNDSDQKLAILNADWSIQRGSSCENWVPRHPDCLYDWNGYKRLPMTSAGAFCSQYEIENQDKAGF